MIKYPASHPKAIILACVMYIVFAILLNGCSRRSETIEAPKPFHQFSTLKNGSDERLIPLMDSLQKLEEQRPFMDNAIGAYGYPLWEYAVLEKQNGGLTVLAPLVQRGSSKVSGLIALRNDGKFKIRLFDAGKPAKYGFSNDKRMVNARTIFITADLFTQRAFDHDPAAINDPCMMSGIERAYIYGARMSNEGKKITLTARGIEGYIETCYYTTVCMGDGSGNCVGEVTVHKDCIFSYIWVDDSSTDGQDYNLYPEDKLSPKGGSGTGHSPGTSNDCNGTQEQDELEGALAILPPAKPITNVAKYLSCFSPNRGAIISFFADQPMAGSTDPFSMKEKTGHAFLTIEQFENGRIIRRTVGFHPSDVVSPFLSKSSESQLGDDSNEPYDVQLGVSITPDNLKKILNLIQNYNPMYHLEDYNCTNFVLDVADACGIQINRTKGSWGIGSGVTPANFGEDLKKIPGAVTGYGKSKENAGNCN